MKSILHLRAPPGNEDAAAGDNRGSVERISERLAGLASTECRKRPILTSVAFRALQSSEGGVYALERLR